jgi:predicted dehydrogenase
MTSAPPLRTAIVGCGSIARAAHISNTAALEELDLAALCDLDESRARAQAEEHGVPGVYTDHQEMLAKEAPELVIICTMPVTHREIAIAALEAGAHVLCEKPFTTTVAESEEVLRAACEHQRLLTVALNLRFDRRIEAMKAMADSGELGSLFYGRAWSHEDTIPAFGPHYRAAHTGGGGTVINSCTHTIDACLWVMGYPRPSRVGGATFTRFHAMGGGRVGPFQVKPEEFDVEDLAGALITFEDGGSLTVESSWSATPGRESNAFEVIGDRGRMRREPFEILLSTPGGIVDRTPLDLGESDAWAEGGAYRRELADFARVIRDGGVPRVTPEEALTLQRVLNGLYDSAATGREVVLG